MLELLVLGPVVARLDDEVLEIGSPTHRLLLAVLAVGRPGPVTVARLIEALWDEPPANAERSIHSHVWRIRRRLGGDTIARVGAGYRLEVPVDAEQLVAVAGRPDGARDEDLDRVTTQWRGDAFGDLGDHAFLVATRTRLERARSDVDLERARRLLNGGSPGAAIDILERVVDRDPFHELAWARLVDALHSAGRAREALRRAQDARAAFAGIGLETPASVSAAERAVVEPAEQAPARPTVGASGAGAVPRPRSSFLGRDDELDVLVDLLGAPGVVTLVGPGGVGKTRLAVEAVRRVGSRRTVSFCDLSAVRSEGDVVPAVARAVGAPLRDPLLQRIVDATEADRPVVVVDNCEHVLDAVAALVGEWAERSPGVCVLATSRTRLAIAGERVLEVHPLATAPAVSLFRDRVATSLTGSADETTLRQICRRLDGLPLTIEMAAARASSIPIDELASRLERRFDLLGDRRGPPRHRTVGEVVAWSYEGLGEFERRAFEVCSVFAGEFTLSSGEAVVGACVDTEDPAGLLIELCERSLLSKAEGAEPGYRMLETVRDHARSRLDRSPNAERALRAHGEHFLAETTRLASELTGPGEIAAAEQLRFRIPDLRLAHQRASRSGSLGVALGIPGALYHFVYERLAADVARWAADAARDAMDDAGPGVPPEALAATLATAAIGDIHADRLEQARARADASLRTDGGVGHLALLALANVAIYQGDLRASVEHAQSARAAALERDDAYTASVAAIVGAVASAFEGRRDAAEQELATATELAGRAGAPTLQAYVEYAAGELCIESDPDRAIELFDRAVALSSRTGSEFALGIALLSSTSTRARHGDPVDALERYARTIRHWKRHGDWIHVWTTIRNLAVLLARLGRDTEAARLLGSCHERTGGVYGSEADRLDDVQAELRRRLGAPGFDDQWRQGRMMSPEDAVVAALVAIDDAHPHPS